MKTKIEKEKNILNIISTYKIDKTVLFNTIGLPLFVYETFNSLYSTFVLMFIMFGIYEFVIMDDYYELYSKEELDRKRKTLYISYFLYACFGFLFYNQLVDYLQLK